MSLRILTLFVSGLLPSLATAVTVAPSGTGQVLIYPYYSVQDGSQTLLSVVNHDSTGKALKVHIRESRNGRSTASFNLYLAEFDVWTAALFQAADGTPGLLTTDNSCTVPAIKTSTTLPQLPDGRRFLPLSNADYSGQRADGGSTSIDRAGTGYIELIEMGRLIDNSESDAASTQIGQIPADCPRLVAAWAENGYWTQSSSVDLEPPGGQLSGALSLLQVEQGTAYTVGATALEHFSVVVQHSGPFSATPDLASAVTDPMRQTVESLVLAGGRFVRSRWPQERAIDAVSAVLAQQSVQIEYSVEPAIGAVTDWTISMPTRRHYTDPALVATPALPFTVRQTATQGCERLDVTIYNRASARPAGGIDVGPVSSPRTPCLCAATQVLAINRPLAVPPMEPLCGREPFSTNFFGTLFQSGHVDLQLSSHGHRSRPALDGESYEGLPVLGFSTLRYRNNAARPGEIGLYGNARPQHGISECRRDADLECTSP